MNRVQKLLVAQALILFGGTVYAWSKLFAQIDNFRLLHGSLFKFTGYTIPNPLLTACFYGSIAFLIALFWSVRAYQSLSGVNERRLRNFLAFCVAFAASMVLYEAALYYELFTVTVSVTCSPGASPLTTPCFTGMLFFIAAFIISILATRCLLASGRVGG